MVMGGLVVLCGFNVVVDGSGWFYETSEVVLGGSALVPGWFLVALTWLRVALGGFMRLLRWFLVAQRSFGWFFDGG